MMHMEDTMSTVGMFSTVEDTIFCYLSTSTALNNSHGTHDVPTYIMISPTIIKLQKIIFLMVLNTPHSTHDIPHVHHDVPTVLRIPHYTQEIHPWHSRDPQWYSTSPQSTQDIPHIYHDIPHVTENPLQYSKYPPTVFMISSMALNTPTVLNTHYTGLKQTMI